MTCADARSGWHLSTHHARCRVFVFIAGTFTVVHHTAPHIPFKPAGEWNAAKAQLSGTVHCDYPRVRAGGASWWCGICPDAGGG